MPGPGWTQDDAPDLTGRTAIVTGATGGLGFQVALALAAKGADTVLAARNPAKGDRAIAEIRARHPAAKVRFALLDLASLASVAAFADAWSGKLDILVNNGAVMGLPTRHTTQDGFEQQIGVNYLAHFALTLRLRAALEAAPGDGGRVVNVASVAHQKGVLKLDDLQSQRAYHPKAAYRQSKLAMLMFSLELHRRAQAGGWHLQSIAAHPGWSRTDIVFNGPGLGNPGLRARLMDVVFAMVAQPAQDGALPILYAAIAPEAQAGAYYGPDRLHETRGNPAVARVFPHARDAGAAAHLWSLSEQLTARS
jgi:NAD(P)-dependent dehydrogenase (short-subunit alcohol dehydrogenase family)